MPRKKNAQGPSASQDRSQGSEVTPKSTSARRAGTGSNRSSGGARRAVSQPQSSDAPQSDTNHTNAPAVDPQAPNLQIPNSPLEAQSEVLTSPPTIEVAVNQIEAGDGHRRIDHGALAELVVSIQQVGLLKPILVTPSGHNPDGETYALVAGRQRLQAFIQLGRSTIRATILPPDELRNQLARIDENLIRRDLTVLEIGQHWLQRDEILDAMGLRARASPGTNQYTKAARAETQKQAELGVTVTPTLGGETLGTAQADAVVPFIRTSQDFADELRVSKSTLYNYKRIARNIRPDIQTQIMTLELDVANETTRLLDLAKQSHEKQPETFRIFLENQGLISPPPPENTEPIPLTGGPFKTIVIDPPWALERVTMGRLGDELRRFPYATMSIGAITEKVREILALADEEGCYVFLWIVHALEDEARQIFRDCKIDYFDRMVWFKNRGMQNKGRGQRNYECILIGKKGDPPPLKIKDEKFRLCFPGKARAHSRKPEEFYDILRRISPVPRLDAFARQQREGFEAWGDQVGLFTPETPSRWFDFVCRQRGIDQWTEADWAALGAEEADRLRTNLLARAESLENLHPSTTRETMASATTE